MKTDIIRKKFLDFFKTKNHKIVPGDALIPKDDPTVLFTSAGMNQFKEYFLGIKKDLKRAASCQKCFRTADIDKVGKTPAHHTFFEMLGNFSFGDYFKKEAIAWSWEFMTEVMGLKPEDLWVSVYRDDDEAYDIWHKEIKVPASKIVRLGDKDNFWPQEAKQKGPNGPCGPCSEIFFDQGTSIGCGRPDCSVACDCGRFVEVWNLVFTQFNRKDAGVLEPLPMKNIDTGMGLERLAAVMQGVRSNFQIDIFKPIVEAIVTARSEIASLRSQQAPQSHQRMTQNDKTSINTIADHTRAVAFLIVDGILPSNEGRGYVERMVIRRAARAGIQPGIQLCIDKPFLYKIVPAVVNVMKGPYPELEQRQEFISQVLLAEENRFKQTLQEGIEILDDIMAGSRTNEIPGEIVFKLYDTYGFPLDLTESIAMERGFKIDRHGFEKAMQRQRELSRKSSFAGSDIFAATFSQKLFKKITKETEFIGYTKLELQAKVLALMRKEEPVEQANRGDEVWVILDKTPFYAEAGGQVGDTGKIIKIQNPKSEIRNKSKIPNSKTGRIFEDAELDVLDTKIFDKIIAHVCRMSTGSIKVGDEVIAQVDRQRRMDIAKNHTATHLLQYALRKVLGDHVHQAGSLVAPERLRFDFTHFKPVTQEQIGRIEQLVNDAIMHNEKLRIEKMATAKAKKQGTIALFGEKYDEFSRVVSIGSYSKELCAGTHLKKTKDIGSFKIINESSISAGTRRIEAVTGRFVKEAVEREKRAALEKVQKEKQALLKAEQDKLRRNKLLDESDQIIKGFKEVGGVKVIAREISSASMEDLRSICDRIKSKVSGVAVLLASKSDEKVSLALALSKELVEKGLDANRLIKDISKIVDGGGGGRADMAQAGGSNPGKLKEALQKFEGLIKTALNRE